MRWVKGDIWDSCFDQNDVLVGTVMKTENDSFFWQNFTNGGGKGYNKSQTEAIKLAEGK